MGLFGDCPKWMNLCSLNASDGLNGTSSLEPFSNELGRRD